MPVTATVLSGVEPEHAGSASGLLQTTQQLGARRRRRRDRVGVRRRRGAGRVRPRRPRGVPHLGDVRAGRLRGRRPSCSAPSSSRWRNRPSRGAWSPRPPDRRTAGGSPLPRFVAAGRTRGDAAVEVPAEFGKRRLDPADRVPDPGADGLARPLGVAAEACVTSRPDGCPVAAPRSAARARRRRAPRGPGRRRPGRRPARASSSAIRRRYAVSAPRSSTGSVAAVGHRSPRHQLERRDVGTRAGRRVRPGHEHPWCPARWPIGRGSRPPTGLRPVAGRRHLRPPGPAARGTLGGPGPGTQPLVDGERLGEQLAARVPGLPARRAASPGGERGHP